MHLRDKLSDPQWQLIAATVLPVLLALLVTGVFQALGTGLN